MLKADELGTLLVLLGVGDVLVGRATHRPDTVAHDLVFCQKPPEGTGEILIPGKYLRLWFATADACTPVINALYELRRELKTHELCEQNKIVLDDPGAEFTGTWPVSITVVPDGPEQHPPECHCHECDPVYVPDYPEQGGYKATEPSTYQLHYDEPYDDHLVYSLYKAAE